MSENIDVIFGSGNVYADLGYDHPEEQLAKAEIVARIARIIEERALTQAQAAEVMGVTQPNVSDLLRGRFRGYSLDRLFRLLVALDDDVSIMIGPKREGHARLSVIWKQPTQREMT
jgi:predicted XRE-type DNA-binding protein